MKSALLVPLLFKLCPAIALPGKVSYDGYKVFRVGSVGNANRVNDILSSLSLATWKNNAASNSYVNVVVSPGQLQTFEEITGDMEVSVMHDNLGASIAEESTFEAYAVGSANITWFNSYHGYADHLQFLNDLRASFPSNSEIITAGNSVQGRPITSIYFWGSDGKGSKPAVVFHSTVHTRE